MLQTGKMDGKCADLNPLFVGPCVSVGVPARDVYGRRLTPSVFGYKESGGNLANLKGGQDCRAEVFLKSHGWVAKNPPDVLKVMRQESSEWIKGFRHPLAAPVKAGLFGSGEGNWMARNTANHITLPGRATKATLSFSISPNGENASGKFDSLSPDSFRYAVGALEIV